MPDRPSDSGAAASLRLSSRPLLLALLLVVLSESAAEQVHPSLTFYTHGLCPYAQRIALALHWKKRLGVPRSDSADAPERLQVSVVEINFVDKPPWYEERLGTKLVPAMEIDGVARHGSLDLLKRLEEIPGYTRLMPSDPLMAHQVNRLIDFGPQLYQTGWKLIGANLVSDTSDEVVPSPEFPLGWTFDVWGGGVDGMVAAPEPSTPKPWGFVLDELVVMAWENRVDTLVESLKAFGGPFLVGSQPTLADCMLAPFLARFELVAHELGGYNMREAVPVLGSYLKHIEQTEAWQLSFPQKEPFVEAIAEHGSLDYFVTNAATITEPRPWCVAPAGGPTASSGRRLGEAAAAQCEAPGGVWSDWVRQWQDGLETWWAALPLNAREGLGACAGALGLHLASRLELLLQRAGLRGGSAHSKRTPTAASAEAAECRFDGLEIGGSSGAQLPDFPPLPSKLELREETWPPLIPIPRLLPSEHFLRSHLSRAQLKRMRADLAGAGAVGAVADDVKLRSSVGGGAALQVGRSATGGDGVGHVAPVGVGSAPGQLGSGARGGASGDGGASGGGSDAAAVDPALLGLGFAGGFSIVLLVGGLALLRRAAPSRLALRAAAADKSHAESARELARCSS